MYYTNVFLATKNVYKLILLIKCNSKLTSYRFHICFINDTVVVGIKSPGNLLTNATNDKYGYAVDGNLPAFMRYLPLNLLLTRYFSDDIIGFNCF